MQFLKPRMALHGYIPHHLKPRNLIVSFAFSDASLSFSFFGVCRGWLSWPSLAVDWKLDKCIYFVFSRFAILLLS